MHYCLWVVFTLREYSLLWFEVSLVVWTLSTQVQVLCVPVFCILLQYVFGQRLVFCWCSSHLFRRIILWRRRRFYAVQELCIFVSWIALEVRACLEFWDSMILGRAELVEMKYIFVYWKSPKLATGFIPCKRRLLTMYPERYFGSDAPWNTREVREVYLEALYLDTYILYWSSLVGGIIVNGIALWNSAEFIGHRSAGTASSPQGYRVWSRPGGLPWWVMCRVVTLWCVV